jgi:hypothetical protein
MRRVMSVKRFKKAVHRITRRLQANVAQKKVVSAWSLFFGIQWFRALAINPY